jgi:hypothetical protein
MAGLDPAIHVFPMPKRKSWMPGSSPGMTNWNDVFPKGEDLDNSPVSAVTYDLEI